ncbi:hypothetical protein MKX03_024788 [Papaver bracteatum]|nr:hypothetical protein MKX03_024788 [Papaver bracteatum]
MLRNDYNVSPQPSKEVARMIKKQLVQENQELLSGALSAFDGRKNLYSSVEFQEDKLEFFVNLPIPTTSKSLLYSEVNNELVEEKLQKSKLFRVNVKLVSRLDGNELVSYLSKDWESEEMYTSWEVSIFEFNGRRNYRYWRRCSWIERVFSES